MSWISSFGGQAKTIFVICATSLAILLGIETVLIYVFDYNEVVDGNLNCKVYDERLRFSFYRSNCEVSIKNWEQDTVITYAFNNSGRREPEQPRVSSKIAFFGDSFTMGAMVPIEENYNFKALAKFDPPKYRGYNYGVAAAQFHNVLEKLKFIDTSEFDYIVYGLTPNDMFDIVDGTAPSFGAQNAQNETNKENLNKKVFQNFFLSLATTRFLLHNLMSSDDIYLRTYKSRTPYAGYLTSPLPEDFASAMDSIMAGLNSLEQSKRKKLIVFLLPQRAEVVAARLKQYDPGFRDHFLENCYLNGLNCAFADVYSLAEIPESHFPVDGHLTTAGNAVVADDLFEVLSKLEGR